MKFLKEKENYCSTVRPLMFLVWPETLQHFFKALHKMLSEVISRVLWPVEVTLTVRLIKLCQCTVCDRRRGSEQGQKVGRGGVGVVGVSSVTCEQDEVRIIMIVRGQVTFLIIHSTCGLMPEEFPISSLFPNKFFQNIIFNLHRFSRYNGIFWK